MKYMSLVGLVWLLFSNAACADIILTAVANGPSVVERGNSLVFDVFARSTVAGGQVIEGIDLNVNAATTAGGVGTGAAGRFVAPSELFLISPAQFDVVGNGPGQAFGSVFRPGGSTIASTDTLFGRLTLSTANVNPGNYFISFDQMAAFNTAVPGIGISGVGATYTVLPVTAVPEPGSLALVGLAGCGVAAWRRRSKAAIAIRSN